MDSRKALRETKEASGAGAPGTAPRQASARNPDRWIAAALAVASICLVRLTSLPIGFVRDEGYYFKAALQYVGWYRAIANGELGLLEALGTPAIDQYFGYNPQHPALVKILQGFSWWIWHEILGIGSNAEALRLPGALFTAVCVASTFLLGRRLFSRPVGLFAALAWLFMPRNFVHEHLAAFDVPITAMTVLVVYLYARAGDSKRRATAVAIAFGLTMATKHNSLFIPPLLILHWLATTAWRPEPGRYFRFVRPARVPPALVRMLWLGPLVFVAHWPWLWHKTFLRIGRYYGYHFLHHEHYPIAYWGELLRDPPFPVGFAFGMTLVTMPLPLLGLMVWGLALAVRDGFFRVDLEPRSHAWLLGLFALFPMFVISLPSTPIFGGVKHWMPATPFLAILAGRALEHGIELLRPLMGPMVRSARVFYAVAPLFLATAVIGIIRTHPHGLSYYNELVGGARGAAMVGMQRHFWGEAVKPLLSEINTRTPSGGSVMFNRSNLEDFAMYRRDGLVRQDIENSKRVAEGDGVIVFHQWEHEHILYTRWNEMPDRRPVQGVYLEGGVPLTTLYMGAPEQDGSRPEAGRAPSPDAPEVDEE